MLGRDAVQGLRAQHCAVEKLTQRYGKPGSLTCHNRRAPCNRRNVGSTDFAATAIRRRCNEWNLFVEGVGMFFIAIGGIAAILAALCFFMVAG